MYLIAGGLAGGMLLSPRARGDDQAPPPGPVISFEEKVHDAGEVWEGESVQHVFTFTNSGTADLEITRVRTTCGCTAGVLSEKILAPGESGEIRASFNTRGYRGRRSMPVFVHSNDPVNSTVQLRIEATVKNVAVFDPRNLSFGQVTRGEKATRETRLVFDGDPVPVREVSARPEFFSARILEPETGEDGSGEASPVRIEVEISPDAPVGRHRGTLTARLDHPGVSSLNGRLMATVEGPLLYSPRLLFFNETEQAEGAEKKIRVTNQGQRPIAVRKAESDLDQFQVTVRELDPGREFVAAVRLRPEAEPGRYAGQVTIETDLPEEGTVTVPLRANVGR